MYPRKSGLNDFEISTRNKSFILTDARQDSSMHSDFVTKKEDSYTHITPD